MQAMLYSSSLKTIKPPLDTVVNHSPSSTGMVSVTKLPCRPKVKFVYLNPSPQPFNWFLPVDSFLLCREQGDYSVMLSQQGAGLKLNAN